ncbi:MAG: GYF domain-containing protein [Bacillota bacterium]|nr:GYF domain-containing protein [Bacillota bacterium]
MEENTFVQEDERNDDRKIWYYVSEGNTVGGFSEAQMLELVKNGTITKKTYVWREGDADWRYASNSLLGSFFEDPTQEQTYDSYFSKTTKKEWYYADASNNQFGPFDEKEMIRYIQEGTIKGNSYVWKPGLEEWIHLRDSSLAGYAKQQTPEYTRSNTENRTVYTSTSVIKSRNIAVAILLSFVTCGIYSVYWYYSLIKDANTIAKSQGQNPVFDPGLALVVNICTCGLFSFYLYWKMGKHWDLVVINMEI